MRYFAVALIGYVIDFGLLVICKEVFGLHYLLAAIIGFVAGLTVLYILSGKYVFGTPKLKSRVAEFGAFAAIGVVGLALLTVLMWLLTDFAKFNYLISKIAATIVVYLWNFFARKALYYN